MTHNVLQSSSMTPEEFAADKSTHVRSDSDSLNWPARILERQPNGSGEVPVQFADGFYGTIDIADIGTDLELFTPLHDLPPELWFVRQRHGEFNWGFGPCLPTGLRLGPYTRERRAQLFADEEHGEAWAKHDWVKYVPAGVTP